LGSVLKISERAKKNSTPMAAHWLRQKWVGPHFGRFFHKLVWSPWRQTMLQQERAEEQGVRKTEIQGVRKN
jgi:hypothetical protein